jgi:hypothetical protein
LNPRSRALAIALAAMLALIFGRQFLNSLPYQPRLVLQNALHEAIAPFEVGEDSRAIDFGAVPARSLFVMPIEPRAGVVYTIYGHAIPGEELVRQLDFARQERRDVRIRVWQNGEGLHYVSIEGDMVE